MPSARIRVRVIPRAGRNQVGEPRGDAIAIRLQAPPVGGAANKALTQFLAEVLGVRAGDVRIESGAKSRNKVVLVEGLGQEEAETRLAAARR